MKVIIICISFTYWLLRQILGLVPSQMCFFFYLVFFLRHGALSKSERMKMRYPKDSYNKVPRPQLWFKMDPLTVSSHLCVNNYVHRAVGLCGSISSPFG